MRALLSVFHASKARAHNGEPDYVKEFPDTEIALAWAKNLGLAKRHYDLIEVETVQTTEAMPRITRWDESQTVTYLIRVKDTYCGLKGEYEEECETTSKEEADHWWKQWRKEYTAAKGFEGYKVTRKLKIS